MHPCFACHSGIRFATIWESYNWVRTLGLPDEASDIIAKLSVPKRVLLFCVASGTEWERAGITGAVITFMIVRGLVQRDPVGRLSLTKEGRAVFQALIGAR